MVQIEDYYKEVVETLDFIEDEEAAEEGIKCVLGIISSELSEQEAREFTARLPDYLSYEVLRGHQVNLATASPEDTIQIVRNKLELEEEEASRLVEKILGVMKEQASGEISQLAVELSDDWREMIDQA